MLALCMFVCSTHGGSRQRHRGNSEGLISSSVHLTITHGNGGIIPRQYFRRSANNEGMCQIEAFWLYAKRRGARTWSVEGEKPCRTFNLKTYLLRER